MSDDEIELICDGYGLAVIGDKAAVKRFLDAEGMPSKDLDLPRLTKALSTGGAGTQITAQLAENSGRWIKVSADSAKDLRRYNLMKGPTKDLQRSVLMTDKGKVKGHLEIVKTGKLTSNPALLSGAAGLMTQLAMQQAMDEITDYLARIDAKLDDVLQAQTDAVVSHMLGVGFDIDEAMALRDHVGRVSDVTWSKVQAASSTIARTQSYALLQLKALAERLEKPTRISDLMKAAQEADKKTGEWLMVLARCFQLQDAIAVLEIDRVMETAPDDLEGHRLGLRAARDNRLSAIETATGALLARMEAASTKANSKVLWNPSQSPTVVQHGNHLVASIGEFHELLGISADTASIETRRWKAAAGDVRDKAREAGSDGLDVARRFSGETREKARALRSRVSSEIAERKRPNSDSIK